LLTCKKVCAIYIGKIVETQEFSAHPDNNQKVKATATGLQTVYVISSSAFRDKSKELVADLKQSFL